MHRNRINKVCRPISWSIAIESHYSVCNQNFNLIYTANKNGYYLSIFYGSPVCLPVTSNSSVYDPLCASETSESSLLYNEKCVDILGSGESVWRGSEIWINY